jgi:hypothetical protein
VAIAETGYTVATRCFDPPHMRFNVADAHLSALLLPGRIRDALDVAERVRQQAWGYRYHVPYTTALAVRGCTGKAAAALGALDKLRRPFRSLDY